MHIEALPYAADMIAHYESLQRLPGFVLLESTDKHHGRYDILSACPYDNLTVRRGDDLLKVYQQINARMQHLDSPVDLPFQGGAIGYFTYDFADGCAMKPLHHEAPIVDFSFYDWGLVTDHQQKKVYLISANFQAETKSTLKIVKDLFFSAYSVDSYQLTGDFVPLMTRHQYQEAFTTIHRELLQGRAYQVNLTQAFLAPFKGESFAVYKKMRKSNPVPYAAYRRGEFLDVLSFSPERFLLIDKGHVCTSPIKGTIPSAQHEDDKRIHALKTCPKNRAENIMIVDLMRNDLSMIAQTGSVCVTALCEVQSFRGLHHLVSQIEATMKQGLTPLDVFAACFPGGSITGAPKKEAMKMIREHETISRGVYCGSMVYHSFHGRMDSNIAIRTMTAAQNQLCLAAGGGIVVDSLADDEYQECFTKIKALLASL